MDPKTSAVNKPDAPRATQITIGYKALSPSQNDRLEQIEVNPEVGDAPPWDALTNYKTVGTDVDRIDGMPKATGRAKYAYDMSFPGMADATSFEHFRHLHPQCLSPGARGIDMI